MKILLSGGTGFIGRALVPALLAAGHELTLLSRRPSPPADAAASGTRYVQWDPLQEGAWMQAVNGKDCVIHLAGENVVGSRWTPSFKERLVASRVRSAELLVTAIERAATKPRILISGSAVGYYGNTEDRTADENSSAGEDFLAQLCLRWEEAARKAEDFAVRVVLARIGLVLERDGGPLAKMLIPFKLGLGGPVGSGRQWFPWVHRADVQRAIVFALDNQQLSGPCNLVAPAIVRQREFSATLARALRRPAFLPVPAFALRLLLGEAADALLIGQRAQPTKLIEAGFRFQFPALDGALEDIVRRSS